MIIPKCESPGFVGAGTKLPLGIGKGSSLGYAVKPDIHFDTKDWEAVSFDQEETIL